MSERAPIQNDETGRIPAPFVRDEVNRLVLQYEEPSHLVLVKNEIAAPPVSPYEEVDKFITGKARDFYGMRAISTPVTGRLRIIQKALKKMPDLDDKTESWVRNFSTETAIKLGDIALHQSISVPVPPHDEVKNWTTKSSQTLHIFRYPKVCERVIRDLAISGDPSAYVIKKLEDWRGTHVEQPSNLDKTLATRTFEQVLFGIHGEALASYVQDLLAEHYNELDIPSSVR